MKAHIHTNAHGDITILMEGGLDYENSIPLRQELLTLSSSHPMATITLDMHKLDFVGSSGIGHFAETIKILHRQSFQIRLSNVKSEFVKVFKIFDLNILEMIMQDFEHDDEAKEGEGEGDEDGDRPRSSFRYRCSRTFQN